ncbi:hypothetical protein ACFYRC_34175 [Streptomyces sp. NPDC005279]|uniref:hypothetical protein n=1 Tax=Streptomyces sp. NPDC005279 TaxID=3364712 RepID=UPI00367773B3
MPGLSATGDADRPVVLDQFIERLRGLGSARHNDAAEESNALDSRRAEPLEPQGVERAAAALGPSSGSKEWPNRRRLKRL